MSTTWKYDSVRPEVESASPYVPGLSIEEIRQSRGLANIIKMASNENPLGTSPLVQEVLSKNAGLAFRYPQSGSPRLIKAIAAHHGIDPSRIVPGNGSDEIIDLLLRSRAVPGRHNVVIFKPSFSIYYLQARLCGLELRQCPLNEDFSFNFAGLSALVDENTALVFITTPDNPSGFCPGVEEMASFAASLPAGCLLVIDEAYMDFTDDEDKASLVKRLDDFPNVAILRTFSKSFGLAGLRLGYGILPPRLAEYLMRVRLPFSVNILAEEAGIAALADEAFRETTLKVVREGRADLSAELAKLGCRVYPSMANFIMFAPPKPVEASGMFEKLLDAGIIVRPLKSYGLPHLLRVSIGSEAENKSFLAACGALIKSEITSCFNPQSASSAD